MSPKTDKRRADLRASLIDIAETHIIAGGLGSLKARALATEAGCAVGAIYNVVGDLHDLTLMVNARTFKRMGAEIAANTHGDTPTERLISMSHAYLDFADANQNAWRALFDLDRPEGATAPDWYLTEMGHLFAIIDGPIKDVFTEMTPDDHALMTRALFSSVHGIVTLGLDQASAGVPLPQLRRMIALVLTAITH